MRASLLASRRHTPQEMAFAHEERIKNQSPALHNTSRVVIGPQAFNRACAYRQAPQKPPERTKRPTPVSAAQRSSRTHSGTLWLPAESAEGHSANLREQKEAIE
jgi:hypothetical protein